MKLQFGILYRDERVADSQDLTTVLGEYASYNAETSGEFFDGALLMGYRGDKITWEEDTETQPFSLGPYSITFDGRLDNREDIAATIGITADRNLPDPVLILKAYEKYGDSLLPDLIGEFALVLWRKDTRELTFVRSVDGARSLFYVMDDRHLMWCTDIAHLIRVAGLTTKVDRRYIYQYLFTFPSSHLTPFEAVYAVPAGKALRFGRNTISPVLSLWEPRNITPINYKSDAEYEDRFRHELRQAIRPKLRAKGKVFAELSGGLDSSTLTLIAHNILLHDNRDPHILKTLSMVYNRSRTADERYFIRLVEEMRSSNSIYISEDELHFTTNFDDISFTGLPSLFQLRPGKFRSYTQHMAADNARLLLTGEGGDSIFCSTPRPEMLVADLLYGGRVISAHQCCIQLSRFTGIPYFNLLRRSLPSTLQSAFPQRWQDSARIPSWVNLDGEREAFVDHSNISFNSGLSPSQMLRIRLAESFFRATAASNINDHPQLYVSHPYSHRPLVEFCIAVPMSQMQREGETRSLQRRALSRHLPEKIVKRRGKALLEEPYSRAVQRNWEQLGDVSTWRICIDGYVRAQELQDSMRQMQLGVSSHSANFVPVALALEGFLRSLSMLYQDSHSTATLAS